jgi:hypothetical protein
MDAHVKRLALALALVSVAHAKPARKLDPKLGGWTAANRARIDAMLVAHASSPTRAVATFDWDNTMMRNDIGDIAMAWMLRHGRIMQPPGRDWARTSGALTSGARAALNAACDKAGDRALDTVRNIACADEIFSIYSEGKTAAGVPAWTKPITLTTNESYAWEARLLGGASPDEAASYARQAYREAAVAPIGATQTVGTHKDVGAWVRIYDQMRDLVGALQADNFDVWIVSASPQAFAEVLANEVGIPTDHVVGVRNAVDKHRYTWDLESCGDAPANSIMTFDQGKRCWINKAIFHAPVEKQRAKGEMRQAFAAGDSDTDIAFVQDASELKVAIDRRRMQLMCNAWANAGGRWLVQPMFIEPMALSSEPYHCAAAVDITGARILDENGQPIADQQPR